MSTDDVDETIADAYDLHGRAMLAKELPDDLEAYRPLVDRFMGLWKNLMLSGWNRADAITITLHRCDWPVQCRAGIDCVLGMGIRWV
jgi:hypothetical protein